ncbi:hypothetical protein ABZ215_14300 [Amycolatopsis sp. NPDC006131]|uniref:hypothetical protein n=1 Tax=Amycolatopsis sp. NPDC006131 TaxID=3156731 RepID=UPI0033A4D93B
MTPRTTVAVLSVVAIAAGVVLVFSGLIDPLGAPLSGLGLLGLIYARLLMPPRGQR